MKSIKTYLPYLIAFLTFIIVSLAYFSPILEGKKILQNDIVQFTGMSKEIQDYRAQQHEEPYWTDSAFIGMPAYQISAKYPNDFIKTLDQIIRFLPRPADYLFLYFIGFFILMLTFRVDWKLALIGALAFGLTTYYIVILGVGHNAKAHAIGYFSLVLSGVILTFNKRYLIGFITTTLSVALEITTGHIQMTYYLFFVLLAFGIYKLYETIYSKKWKPFIISSLTLILSGILAIGINANHLLPTREYAKFSTRNISELKLNPDGSVKTSNTALDKNYITEYSYGISETFNLLIPRFMGGGNSENIGTSSETYKFLRSKIGLKQAKDFTQHAPMYWGAQPIVVAPAYIGAILIYLFVLSLFILKPTQKWWLLGVIILALLLSWGKNFNFLTDFFINYIPLYDKFRAVSSIQVILEWTIPILGILGLQQLLFNNSIDIKKKEKFILHSLFIVGGISLTFTLFGTSLFAFEGHLDSQYNNMLPGIAEKLVNDRKHFFFLDSLRSLILICLAFGILWFFLKKKIKTTPIIIGLGVLLFIDGYQIAKRYVNNNNFVRANKVTNPFTPSNIDLQILKDTTHYRVANFSKNPMNDGSTSYFHKSIGGYHAAKPRRYQELFDYQIGKGNMEILNMVNTKYFIGPNQQNQIGVELNKNAYGHSWFANRIILAENADDEIIKLDSLDHQTAIINHKFKDELKNISTKIESTANINLIKYKPNELTYTSNSTETYLALFSEQYYPCGWKAFIDGKPQKIINANYILRALVIPKGTHRIKFEFKPNIVKQGARWSLISYISFIILTLIIFIINHKKQTSNNN